MIVIAKSKCETVFSNHQKEMKTIWLRALRSAILLVLALLAFVGTKTFLWMPLLILAIFFFAIDVQGIDKKKSIEKEVMNENQMTYGVLGSYVVDETPSVGLFIQLYRRPVFVDIRQDRLEESRRARAVFLYEHQTELGEQLNLFLMANPQFAARSIQYIGLHSENIEQGEVFWDPDGYSLLQGMTFSA